MTLFPVILALIGNGPTDGTLDRSALLRLLESGRTGVTDISCEYEGDSKLTTPSAEQIQKYGPRGRIDDFSGLFIERADGAALVDIYHRTAPDTRPDLRRQTIAVIGGQLTDYFRSEDHPGARGEIRVAGPTSLSDPQGSYGRLYDSGLLTGLLRDDGCTFAREGRETIDGRSCDVIVLTLHMGGNPAAAPYQRYRFCIDLARGGVTLKREGSNLHISERPSSRLRDVQVARFHEDGGPGLWLPISGRYEAFVGSDDAGRPAVLHSPTFVESIKMINGSVTVNSHYPDSRFSVRFKSQTLISDQMRRLQYEFGQDRRSPPQTRSEAERRLQEQVRAANAQGEELKASSPARGGNGSWASWFLIGVSVAVLGFALFLWRRSA